MKRSDAPEVPEVPAAAPGDAIAIVGLAGRFPGARTVGAFWRNLEAGVESISRFGEAELEDAFSDEVRRAPNFVRARPVLEDVDRFDADFFGMYAREAELTDPQQRLFLECAWEALEDASCDPRRYRGAIGVFAGCSINTYFLHHVCSDRRALEEFTSNYQVGCYPQLLGAGLDFLATRVSYKLDLRGPSIDLQAACSTSLLAVAQACQSLLLYQADMALAGGVSISFPQKRGYLHQEGAMVSADGSCRPFDARASGTNHAVSRPPGPDNNRCQEAGVSSVKLLRNGPRTRAVSDVGVPAEPSSALCVKRPIPLYWKTCSKIESWMLPSTKGR